jgi:hypothetical protein
MLEDSSASAFFSIPASFRRSKAGSDQPGYRTERMHIASRILAVQCSF